MSNPRKDGMDNYKRIIDHNGQPIYVPFHTEGNTTSSNISRISKKYERQATVTFKSGIFAEYEEFKQTMRIMSKILDWDTEQFGKKVFLSLAGKATEHINEMSKDNLCDADKVFEKLDKTFFPENYQGASLEKLGSMKFKTVNKLSEFYEDMKVVYNKTMALAVKEIMEEDITLQFCMALSPEVYVKCLNKFHLQGEEIAARYDKLISWLKDDNYVEVDKSSTEVALSILKGSSKVPDKGAHKVSFNSMNYYQYDSRPANEGQCSGNRQRNHWNNNVNHNRSNQNPQGNRDNNSNQNQGNS